MNPFYQELMQCAEDALEVARYLKFANEEFRAVPIKWFNHLSNAVQRIKDEEEK